MRAFIELGAAPIATRDAESAYRQTLTPSRAAGNAGGKLAVRDTEAATARHLVVAYRDTTPNGFDG